MKRLYVTDTEETYRFFDDEPSMEIIQVKLSEGWTIIQDARHTVPIWHYAEVVGTQIIRDVVFKK